MFIESKSTWQTNPKCSSRLFRPSSVSCLKVKRSWKRFVLACVQSNINPGWAVDRVLLCWGGPSHRSVLGDARHPRGHLWEQTEAGGNRWRLSDPGENLCLVLLKVHDFCCLLHYWSKVWIMWFLKIMWLWRLESWCWKYRNKWV